MQIALQAAQEDLAETQRNLDKAKEKLAGVEAGIATLQAKYQDCLAKKDELDNKYQLCEARLIRADKVRQPGEKISITVTTHMAMDNTLTYIVMQLFQSIY